MPTPQGIAAANAESTGEAWLVLLDISHASLSTPIRVANNHVDVTRGGNAYVAFPFELQLPRDEAAERPVARLRFDNIGEFEVDGVKKTLADIVRSAGTPATVAATVVLGSDPNLTEAGPFEMTLRNVKVNALEVAGDLYLEDVLNEPFPADSFVPSQYPGMF
jgi:hypothetical protein